MAVARPIPGSDRVVAAEPASPQAAWRTGPVFVTPVRKGDARPSAADTLVDYAIFALDQQGQYCQQ